MSWHDIQCWLVVEWLWYIECDYDVFAWSVKGTVLHLTVIVYWLVYLLYGLSGGVNCVAAFMSEPVLTAKTCIQSWHLMICWEKHKTRTSYQQLDIYDTMRLLNTANGYGILSPTCRTLFAIVIKSYSLPSIIFIETHNHVSRVYDVYWWGNWTLPLGRCT